MNNTLYTVKAKPGINWSVLEKAPDLTKIYSVVRERERWSPMWNQFKKFILIPELDNYEFDKDGFEIIDVMPHRAPQSANNKPFSVISLVKQF